MRQLGEGIKITLVGLASNIFLTALKGFGGFYYNSASLIADAGHSAGDLLGDIVTIITFRVAQKEATKSYPFGYGKWDAIGQLSVRYSVP